MTDHDQWVASGFCPAIYEDDEGEHWCRLPVAQNDEEGNETHVAPYRYEFPRQESMVRWTDGPLNVEYVVWKPDPLPNDS